MKTHSFYQWLIQYKEYGIEKAKNVIRRLSTLSDDVYSKGDAAIPLFANVSFIKFSQWRNSVGKEHEFSISEKHDLDLYSDFMQMTEITKMPYAEDINNKLQDFCKTMEMTYSYKPVLILSMINSSEKGYDGNFDSTINEFISFYQNRINNGILAESDESVFAKEITDYDKAKKTIEYDPVSTLEKSGVVIFNKTKRRLVFSTEYYVDDSNVKQVKEACLERLSLYYEFFNKKDTATDAGLEPQKQLYFLLQKVQPESVKNTCLNLFEKMCQQNGIKYKEEQSFAIPIISDNDERKIGRLVKETIDDLSKSGFCFSDDMIKNLCSKEWSKKKLGLFYAMFKEYNPDCSIDEQRKDYRNNNRYYNQIFSFGGREVLLTSEWYKESRSRYIEWYNDLIENSQK